MSQSKGQLVYSTDGGRVKNKDSKGTTYQAGSGPCKMRLEKNGRGGKLVTVLFNLPFQEAEALSLMKEFQVQLGCGATFKNSTMEFRGDLRDRIEKLFAAKGFKIIRAGG